MSNWSFRHQMIFLGAFPALLIWTALTFNTLYSSWNTLTTAHQRHGQILVNQIAPNCEFALFSGNLTPLNQLLEQSIRSTDIEQIELYDANAHLLSRIGNHSTTPLTEQKSRHTFSAPVYSTVVQLDAIEPTLDLEGTALGTVEITLSTQPLLEAQSTIIRQALWTGAGTLLIILLLVLWLSMRFTTIFTALRSAMQQIAAGDFSPPKQQLPSTGELGQLSEDLHKMAAALERNRKATLAAYEQLEVRAEEAERLADDQQNRS